MAFKAMLFLLASFLLVSELRVSSNGEEFLMEDYLPTKRPPRVPPVIQIHAKVPVSTPTHSPLKAPPPVHVPIKAPPAAPPVKPPVSAPPVKPPVSAPKPPPIKTRIDCIPPCTERCKNQSRKGLCLRACMTCCDRCKCVPPGTYGNREKCGKCYTDMTTRGDKPKCP
ncbi:gibberellin-regulated protein 14 [Cornus florida]|uniref:gibberellin-regulated protein 14 n=1 Tax=Cornus florida TaxID=4283 RepID=UPI0028971066|nr:gibberellin-regulated protein 14 [Cornus florida]